MFGCSFCRQFGRAVVEARGVVCRSALKTRRVRAGVVLFLQWASIIVVQSGAVRLRGCCECSQSSYSVLMLVGSGRGSVLVDVGSVACRHRAAW